MQLKDDDSADGWCLGLFFFSKQNKLFYSQTPNWTMKPAAAFKDTQTFERRLLKETLRSKFWPTGDGWDEDACQIRSHRRETTDHKRRERGSLNSDDLDDHETKARPQSDITSCFIRMRRRHWTINQLIQLWPMKSSCCISDGEFGLRSSSDPLRLVQVQLEPVELSES